MSSNTGDPEDQAFINLRTLLARAATDHAFRDALLQDPVGTAGGIGITLGDDDVNNLCAATPDLKRFSKSTGVDPDDALSWAIGAVARNVVCPTLGTPDFKVHVFSIQRFAFACPDQSGSRELPKGSCTHGKK